jgi:hypothetical protein
MDNYIELPYKKDYNPCELSSKVACHNMSFLSQQYTKNQFQLFQENFNNNNCYMNNRYLDDIDDIKKNESGLLRGFSINKKSCIYKRPIYNQGDWVNQFQNSDLFENSVKSSKLFDFQSKSKFSNDGSKCDYSKIILPDDCKDKYNTYSSTFTNDYYSCFS